MKSFASSLHAFNQTYHSLQRSAGALLHHAGVILPALVGLYAVATNLLFIPLMQQLWSLTLRFAPVHYLNNSNASDIFVSPAIILCLVVIALLTAFWALYEFSVLLHGLELVRSGRPVQLPALLRDALVDIRHTFLPQNWPVLVYSAVLIPFTSFFLTSNYVTQFAVPEYLLGVLRATTRYHALYLAIVVLLVLLFLSCALVLPLFVLERRSLWQAVRESVGFVRQRIFRTALLLLRWNLSAVLRSGSLALCVLAPLYAVILGIGLQNTAAMVALSRASLLVEVPFFQFLLDCSITIAQCSILFLLYRRLREGDAVPEDTQNGGSPSVRRAVACWPLRWSASRWSQSAFPLFILPCRRMMSCAPCWAVRLPSSRHTAAIRRLHRRTPCPPFSWPSTTTAAGPSWMCR